MNLENTECTNEVHSTVGGPYEDRISRRSGKDSNNISFRGQTATFRANIDIKQNNGADIEVEPLSGTSPANLEMRGRVSFAVDGFHETNLANAKSQMSDENIDLPEAQPKSHHESTQN